MAPRSKKWLKCHPLSGGTLQIALWESQVHTLNSQLKIWKPMSPKIFFFFAEGHALEVCMNDTGDWKGILLNFVSSIVRYVCFTSYGTWILLIIVKRKLFFFNFISTWSINMDNYFAGSSEKSPAGQKAEFYSSVGVH